MSVGTEMAALGEQASFHQLQAKLQVHWGRELAGAASCRCRTNSAGQESWAPLRGADSGASAAVAHREGCSRTRMAV